MNEQPDIKNALNRLLGQELTEQELQFIQFRIAAWDQTNIPQIGFITKIPFKSCERSHLLDIGAISSTDSNGTRQLRLTHFTCAQVREFGYPINVVATPLSEKPIFVTVLQSLVLSPSNTPIDVEMRFFSWDANGAPAPGIPFNWRCRVPFVPGDPVPVE